MDQDVVVVGGGVMGLAAAAALGAAGRRVLLLERFREGHDRGGSHGTSRIFRLGYTDPFYAGLAARCLPLWRRLEEVCGATLLTTTGALDFGLDDAELEALRGGLRGQRVEVLDPVEAGERWPGVAFEGHVVHQPDGGWIRADVVLRALRDLAVARGAQLRFQTRVNAVRSRGDAAEVLTDDGVHRARHVVVAAGPWTQRLVPEARLPPVTTTREQPVLFPAEGATWPSFIHWRHEPGPYGPFEGYGLVAPGAGIKVGLHHAGPRVEPEEEPRIDAALDAAVRDYVARSLPGLDPGSGVAQTCLYDTTATHNFVLDKVGPLTVATGFSGHGFKFAPLIGEVIAGLVAGTAPAPARWALVNAR